MSVELIERAEAPRRRRRQWVGPAVLAAVLAVWWGGHQSWTAYQNRSPYSASAVHARLALTSIETGKAQALLDQLTGGRHLTPVWSGDDNAAKAPQIVGQLTLSVPPRAPAGGHYAFFLVDSRDGGHPTPHLYGWAGTADVASGWDGFYNQIPRRYRDLQGLAMGQDGLGGFTEPGMAILFGAR